MKFVQDDISAKFVPFWLHHTVVENKEVKGEQERDSKWNKVWKIKRKQEKWERVWKREDKEYVFKKTK